MRRLLTQIIIGMPASDAGDSLATALLKAVAFRAALAFLTASLAPTSVATEHGAAELARAAPLAPVIAAPDVPNAIAVADAQREVQP